jgi:hypothetical protein
MTEMFMILFSQSAFHTNSKCLNLPVHKVTTKRLTANHCQLLLFNIKDER